MTPRLVIFDCDGVLIDSERAASTVVAAWLTDCGWPMTTDQAMARFMGMSLPDMEPLIAPRIAMPITPAWREALLARMVDAMADHATLIDGANAALDAVDVRGIPWRVASNSSHAEMAVKFARTGLAARTAGRTHSMQDVARGKPAPDVFLAAAAAQGIPPADCLVIEDSVPGATAAAAAGMRCLGYAPHTNGAVLAAHGAHIIHDLRDIASFLPYPTLQAAS